MREGGRICPGAAGGFTLSGDMTLGMRRDMQGLLIAGAISVLAHLLMCMAIVAQLLPRMPHMPVTSVTREPPRMRLVPPPQPKPMQPPAPSFVDTTGLKQEKPQDPTSNISAQDTRLRSQKQGNLNLALPTQEGVNKPGLTLVETPESIPMQQDQPAPPAPESPMEQKAETEQKEARKGEQKVPEATRGILPRPMEGDETDRPRQEQKKEASKKKAAAPSAPFEFKQDRTALEGGMAAPGDASLDSRATPLGEYQAKVYRAIGSQWKFMVRQQRGLLDLGTVAIDFVVRKDGMLSDVKVDYNTSSSAMLQTISENSVRLVAPFPPFPESVEEQVGEELSFDVKFTIY